jgi:hypothetical protein
MRHFALLPVPSYFYHLLRFYRQWSNFTIILPPFILRYNRVKIYNFQYKHRTGVHFSLSFYAVFSFPRLLPAWGKLWHINRNPVHFFRIYTISKERFANTCRTTMLPDMCVILFTKYLMVLRPDWGGATAQCTKATRPPRQLLFFSKSATSPSLPLSGTNNPSRFLAYGNTLTAGNTLSTGFPLAKTW